MHVGITDLKLHDLPHDSPILSCNDNSTTRDTGKITTTRESLFKAHDELDHSYRLYLQQQKNRRNVAERLDTEQCAQTDGSASSKSHTLNDTCTNIQHSISAESDENSATTCAEHSLKVFAGIIRWGINKYLR